MSVEPICKLVRFVSRYFAVVQDRRAKGDELTGIILHESVLLLLWSVCDQYVRTTIAIAG
jgi:hypothetical protein